MLLDTFAQATGYHRRYGMWLLNHADDVLHAPAYKRASHYGPEVRHALFQVWHAANRICAKRLIPFLPALVEALERHEHLHLTEECRSQLLSMSVATADRLLHSQRAGGLRGISTTKAGTLLKQHIPIRTYHQWNETQPGFLEADLVAHCGMVPQGSYLYTLTLTDVATGWTECLPLLNKSQEMVLAAFHHARTLFPFPILGIDTDCGTEFISEAIATYCADEHITFTRGRPDLKNDQCFVEQKNGAVVRLVVGYDRLEGPHTSEQLAQLYRALRLYVNYFQPSIRTDHQKAPSSSEEILNWPHTPQDPFACVWKEILALVQAHTEWTSTQIQQEIGHQCPHSNPREASADAARSGGQEEVVGSLSDEERHFEGTHELRRDDGSAVLSHS